MVKRGYSAEARRREILKKDGWLVFRVSGSIGPIDLIAIKPTPNQQLFKVRLEQIKSTKQDVYYFDKQAKYEWERMYGYVVSDIRECYFVILFSKRRKWKIVKVDSDKPPKRISYD